jgi:rod shape-determining protein MreC
LQETLNDARRRAGEVDVITQRLDSVTAILATQSALVEENRLLRDMLGLVERGGPRFVPATALRPGTAGSERMFVVDVGSRDGVPMGAAVVGPQGLIGVIHEVRSQSAVGMDWSHPDFRASAMLVDGTSYGIVERRRGIFQEDDRLVLSGTAYTTRVRPGTVVVTSGLAGVLPRGIPIGKIDRLLDTEGSWRKSFWIEPMVEPGAATHVLVLTEGSAGDLSGVWPVDSLLTREEAIGRDPGS